MYTLYIINVQLPFLSSLDSTLQNLLHFTAAKAYITDHFSNVYVPPHSEIKSAVWPQNVLISPVRFK
jgi:hypothetical protein